MKKIITVLLVVLLILFLFDRTSLYSQNSYSQNPSDFINYNEVIGKSPTAAQFLRYDELPVSEYTGIPGITVPLYNIEVDNVNVPIALSYHAGGLKVIQEASWVGLGWDIPAIASITQIVKDEDDLTSDYLFPDWNTSSNGAEYLSFLYKHCWSQLNDPYLQPQPINNVSKQFGYMVSTAGWLPVNGRYQEYFFSSSNKDFEPDIFKINIRGETLNCIIDKNSTADNPEFIVLNKKGYTINYKIDSFLNRGDWEITDPQGTKYCFKTKSEQYNRSKIGGSQLQSAVWYIDKIVSTSGKEIKFNYLQAGTFTNVYKASSKTIRLSREAQSQHATSISQYYAYIDFMYIDHFPTFDYKINIGDPQEYWIEDEQIYLQSIEFPLGKIEFFLSPRTDISGKKKLDAITIKDKNKQQVKGISFLYSYYQGEDNWAKKLKLNSVQVAGENPYFFSYDNQILPAMNSYATDYWGYYNGNTDNKSYAPNPLRWTSMSGYVSTYNLNENSEPLVTKNNHSARLQYAKAGILTKIEYPTKGNTVFEYELNEFSDDLSNYQVPNYDLSDNSISKGCGLRIQEIKYLDSDNSILKREQYSYSGGKISRPINFFEIIHYRYTSSQNLPQHISELVSFTATTIMQCSNSGNYADNPLASFNGVGYNNVTKTTIDQNNHTVGKTVTYYNNHRDETGPVGPSTPIGYAGALIPSLPSIKDSRYPLNGLAYKKIYYNAQGDTVYQDEFEYLNKESSLYYGAKVSGFSMRLHACYKGFIPYSRHILGYYPIFDFESLLTKKTNTQYNGNTSIAFNETYTYDNNHLIKTITATNSNGQTLITLNKYPADFGSTAPYNKMLEKNILNPTVQKITYVEGSNKVISGEITDFSEYSTYLGKIYKPQNISYLLNNNGATINNYNSYRQPKMSFTYNYYGNITTIQDSESELPTTYLWGYNNQYPVVKIEGATYDELISSIPPSSQGFMQHVLSSDLMPDEPMYISFRKMLVEAVPNAFVTTYTYKPLVGITSITDPSGAKTTYFYDSSGRLSDIKDNKNKTIESYEYHYKDQ